jgi:hypothetical protein
MEEEYEDKSILNAEQCVLAKAFLNAIIMGDLSVVRNKYFGICYNLEGVPDIHKPFEEGYGSLYDFVAQNCSEWEHWSGSTMYPIPKESLDTPHDCPPRRWSGQQLNLRQSLCFHLIGKIDEQENL